MKRVKGGISVILVLALLMGVFGGQWAAKAQAAEGSGGSQTVIIKDLAGNSVTVPAPDKLKSIVITSWKGALGSAVLLGQLDKIVGVCDYTKFIWLRYAFPSVAKIPDYGAFDEVNVEKLLQVNADVIISPSAAAKSNEKMKSLGMTVAVDGTLITDSASVFKQTYDEIDLVARLTGTTDKAQRYYAWANNLFAAVRKRVVDIPDAKRVRVLPIRNDILQVYGNNCIWGYIVEMAGGKSLCGDVTAGTGKFFADVDAERIVKWNPDMIFQINYNGEFTADVAAIYSNWAKDKRFADVSALKTGKVFLIPKGIDYWNSVIEAPLCALWMAKIMYPERFADMDVKQYAAKFYKTFLNYSITQKDWQLMAPQYKGAKSNGLSN